MTTHVPSNFATYQTTEGQPVFDTFFALLDDIPVAFTSSDMRDKAMQAAATRGQDGRAVSHKDAFEMLRGGAVAFLYEAGQPWQQMRIADAYRRRLTLVSNPQEFLPELIRFVFKS